MAGQAAEPPKGKRYERTVPDTLDLAERGEIAVNGLSGTLDPENSYEIYLRANFCANPPYMVHETTGLPTNNPKYAESFPMLRVMSGSRRLLDIQAGMMKAMQSFMHADGLYYAPASGVRTWHEGVGHNYGTKTGRDFANVYGNSRMLLAMMAWMQYEPRGPWRAKAAGLAAALSKIAIRKGDYAYYPDSRVGEAFSYPESGWPNTDEPATEGAGAEGSMFMYYCGPIRALTRWHRFTGDKEALATATRLVKFVTRRKFWGIKGTPEDIDAADRAYFTGHMHGHTAMLYALAEYASTVNSTELKAFVRDGYEFARQHGIPRLGGWLNNQPDVEVCTISDMIATAIKLTDAGLGDYYDDVDAAVRNQLVESQLVRPDLIREIAEHSPAHRATSPQETEERVIDRAIGILMPLPFNGYKGPYMINCCTGNGSQGLYYAWSKIVEQADGLTKVNLLLNRVSPWVDVDSYLPYEGKVVLHNKRSGTLCVRLPGWVERKAVAASIGTRPATFSWVGNYAVLPSIASGKEVVLQFPVPDEKVTYTFRGAEYHCRFKGSTLVDISPKIARPGYPIYERANLLASKAPTKKRSEYVAPQVIAW